MSKNRCHILVSLALPGITTFSVYINVTKYQSMRSQRHHQPFPVLSECCLQIQKKKNVIQYLWIIWYTVCNYTNAWFNFYHGLVLSLKFVLILCNHISFYHTFLQKAARWNYVLALEGWTKSVIMGDNYLNPTVAKLIVTMCMCPACIKYVVSFMIFMRTESTMEEWHGGMNIENLLLCNCL